MHVPSLDAWDQFVWLPGAAMPWAITEVEQYSYRCGHAVDLGPIMLVTQFRVTDEEGTYLCVAWALVFEGSVLVYNSTRDEVEWVPAHIIANDLSWVEQRSAVALVNFVPRIPQEVARIARLRAHHLVSWPDDFSLEEEDNGQAEEEENGQTEEEEDGQVEEEQDEGEEEEDPTDMEEQGVASHELLSGSTSSRKGKQSERPNHGDDNDHGSGGLSWTRKNLSLLMTHGQTPMPQLVAAPLCIQPHRSRDRHERLLLRCMHGSQRWRNSELVGHEGHPVLTSVNL